MERLKIVIEKASFDEEAFEIYKKYSEVIHGKFD